MTPSADKSDRIRTGIVGFGLSGRVFHAPFLSTNPAFSLDVIATGNSDRAADAHARHPSARIVSSPDALLDLASDLDLVVLASPAHVHLEQGLRAFEADAAVVVDKPFAASTMEALALIGASEQSGHPLFVFQNRRWDSDFLTLRGVLDEGVLGRVHRFESTFERYAPELRDRWQDALTPAAGAGIVFDLGSHLIDQALQLFGPAAVDHAELRVLREGGRSDDEAFISLLHDSGVRSHLTMSRVAALNGPRFRVLGSEGAFSISGLDSQEPALKGGMLPDDADYGVEPESAWGVVSQGGGAPVPVPSSRGDYPAFYAAVAATLREGAPLAVDPADALAVVRIIERAHELSR